MNPIGRIAKALDAGWWARCMVAFQFWFCYFIVDWSMAFGSAALAAKSDLLGAAAVIGAVAAVPQALLMMATSKYMEMRAGQPMIVADRRRDAQTKPDGG